MMKEPEEEKQSIAGAVMDELDVVDVGIELAADGILDTVGGFLGDMAGGILDGISIDF